ncbi:response regulator [Lentzea albidocapillata]|uniref:Phosphotransferase enzyme family protein n=1 Tax=Lentzea albidocapillata TaxID=40571 RepID=A0A1W2EA95_9PSEU|nr:response regulator [Lentzea albidocapillata]SMD06664.1 Phosphotransferase enzyme family protein [Lentzea albidocapillata]
MRVLLVEDSAAIIEVLQHYSNRRNFGLVSATSVKSALEIIDDPDQDFDVALCDLKIPSQDGAIDLSIENGLEVVRRISEICPGVPVVVLSAFGTLDVARTMLLQARQQDIFGTGVALPMLQYEQKSSGTIAALSYLGETQVQIDEIGEIEVENGESLTERQRRALRIFARRRGGRIVEYRPLSGGFSGARTGLIEVRDSTGAEVARVVSKITRFDRALEEKDRYRQCIAGRLGAGSYADLNDEVLAGCGRDAGLFYSLADTYKMDLFKKVLSDDEIAAAAVRRVREDLSSWVSGVPQTSKTWLEIRRELINDAKYAVVAEKHPIVDVPDGRTLQTVWATQHGDLHGANVLVDDSGRPVLIDFGRAGQAPSVLDPLTLELSVLFHADSPLRADAWPTIEQLDSWYDLDVYLDGCPYPSYVRACREWSVAARAGSRDFYATLNAYCLRNLQYDDVNVERALQLQALAANKLNNS